MKKFYNIILLLFLVQIGFSQTGQKVFDNSYLHEIRITFESDDFWEIIDGNYQNSLDENKIPHDVPYLVGNLTIDGTDVDSVGIRQKGYSSNFLFPNEFKKSLKIDFNEFVKGTKYDGLKKLNLTNGFGDPSMQRNFLSFNLMREAGIKASRVAYAKVYLNDTFWGVYEMIEQVDKTFLKDNFENGKGDLYKNIGFSTLEWKGDKREDYEADFALKTNKKDSDFSDFIEFVDVLNNATDLEFADSIQSVFNVDYFLKVLAIDVMTDNWDSYIDHGRNFYLYHDPETDLFNWIPWDYNFALGAKLRGDGGDLPDYLDECESIKNGSSPYPSTDPVFIEVVNTRSDCCNKTWDQPCQGIYDQISGGGGNDLPDDLNECGSIQNGTSPHLATDPGFIAVVNVNPGCCANWAFECDFIYAEVSKNLKPKYYDFPLIIENEDLVLINRIMKVPAFKEQYLKYCCQILDKNFNIDRLSQLIDHNAALIADDIKLEAHYPFTITEFEYDIGEGSDVQRLPSLKEFLNRRIPLVEAELKTLGIDCSTVGTIEYPNDLAFSIYPNPAESHVVIDLFDQQMASKVDIQIFNALGQLMYTETKSILSNIIIPIETWQTGMYFIKVQNGDFRGMKRLMKQ